MYTLSISPHQYIKINYWLWEQEHFIDMNYLILHNTKA